MSELFAIITTDRPNSVDLRMSTRPEHVAYLKGLGDNLILAGPFNDVEGAPNGSLVIIRADSLKDAQAIAQADPYVGVDLFAQSEVRAWKWAINAPEGI